MTNEPMIWHYGLMAERWGTTILDAPELPYFRQAIDRFGEPVLDVACGAGRLLLPLLRAGIDIDGCDLSSDMLQQCRRSAAMAGFSLHLANQPMDQFEMERRYRTIYICDSFGLAGSRARDLGTLRRCYEHLEAGGALLLNIQAEYASHDSWSNWMPKKRKRLPEPWPKHGSRRVAEDGGENIAYFRLVDIDPLNQRYTREVRIEKKIAGKVVGVEDYALRGNMYLHPEVRLMLEVAGFHSITVHGDYTDVMATAEHKELNFVAVK
jgi:SAM-dependent methyltransferase